MSLATRFAAADLDWIVPEWPAAARVRGFVTTRSGGVSTGASATMDLGSCHPDDAAVLENRRRLRAFLPGDPHWLSQVHGARVVTLDAAACAGSCPEADAAVTAVPGIVCAIRTADCLPVLVADAAGACVGVAHAGWRGLAGGVLEATVAALRALGSSAQAAWLGPAIGSAAFEVGDEVRAAFVAHDPRAAAAFVAGAPGKWFADLYALARMRLHDAGVAAVSGGGLLHAHRRCAILLVPARPRYRPHGGPRVAGRVSATVSYNRAACPLRARAFP